MNSQSLQEQIETQGVVCDDECEAKILGMKWLVHEDNLYFVHVYQSLPI